MLVLTVMVSLLGAAFALVLAFAGIDAKRAFDNDPATRTLSDYIRVWRRLSWTHYATLASGLGVGAALVVWLSLHLLGEVA